LTDNMELTGGQALQAEMANEARVRAIDRMVVHGAPMSFRELCDVLLTGKTKYLVLDLDRTFHFGRNLGELFGWELGAFKTYGPEYYQLKSYRKKPGRFIMDWRHPLRTLRYFFRGAKEWGPTRAFSTCFS